MIMVIVNRPVSEYVCLGLPAVSVLVPSPKSHHQETPSIDLSVKSIVGLMIVTSVGFAKKSAEGHGYTSMKQGLVTVFEHPAGEVTVKEIL